MAGSPAYPADAADAADAAIHLLCVVREKERQSRAVSMCLFFLF